MDAASFIFQMTSRVFFNVQYMMSLAGGLVVLELSFFNTVSIFRRFLFFTMQTIKELFRNPVGSQNPPLSQRDVELTMFIHPKAA